MDHTSLQSGKILQGVISIVNENGYPNMTSLELTIGSVQTTINILYSSADTTTSTNENYGEELVMTGNFYTNDIKVKNLFLFLCFFVMNMYIVDIGRIMHP
jgi:hypothetical protein